MRNTPNENNIEKMKAFLDRAIAHRLRFMKDEAGVLMNDLEVALHRMGKDGNAAFLGDIRSGAWYKASAEVRMLQRTRRAIQDIASGEDPADCLFEGVGGGIVTDPPDSDAY